MSKVAAVGIDDWKLPIFKKHLDAVGYKYEEPVQFTEGALILKVRYEWVHELQPIIEAAQRECAEAVNENARKMLALAAEFNEWQNLAASKGWKLPGNSPLPNEAWVRYWKSMAAYEADPSGGRPVIPHRSGNSWDEKRG